MSERNIVDETFGDISQFAHLSRNLETGESLNTPPAEASCSTPEFRNDDTDSTTSINTKMSEEGQKPSEISIRDASSSPKPDHPHLVSNEPQNIDLASLSPQAHEIRTSIDESEDGSLLASWSGPESLGASDNYSWFDSEKGSINSGQCPTNDNNLENDNKSQQLDQDQKNEDSLNTTGYADVDLESENPENFEETSLPDNDNGELEMDCELNHGVDDEKFIPPDSELNEQLEQNDEDLSENENPIQGDNSMRRSIEATKDRTSLKINHGDTNNGIPNLDFTDESINEVAGGEFEENSEVDLSGKENPNDSLNNSIGNDAGASDSLDVETFEDPLTDAGSVLSDNHENDNDDKLPDGDLSVKGNDLESPSVNVFENMDDEISPAVDNRIPTNEERGDENNSSKVTPPASAIELQGSPGHNAEIVVVVEDDNDLEIREEDAEHGWTILEIWSCFAMAVGAIPFWISNDGQKTQVHRTNASTVLWTFSLFIYAVEFIYVVPKIASFMNTKASGDSYMQLGIVTTLVIFRAACILTALLGERSLVETNNRLLRYTRVKMNNLKAGLIMLTLLSTTIITIFSFITFKSQLGIKFSGLRFENVLNTLQCEGKKQLTMSVNCSPSANETLLQITWATSGFLFMAHETTMKTFAMSGVLIFCCTLLVASYDIEGTEMQNQNDEYAHVTSNDLTNITKLAENMSNFINYRIA